MEPFPLFLFLEGPTLMSVPPLANAHTTKNPKQYTKMAILIADSFILLPKNAVMVVSITTTL